MSNVPRNPSGGSGVDTPWQRWQDWINLILGIWLFISPWFWHAPMTPAWNQWILGVIVIIMALWALGAPDMSAPEWINVLAGIWLFIAPWALGFYASYASAWDQWIVGVIVFILAISTTSRFGSTQTPRHLPTS